MKNIFFDLEETIIESWDDQILCNLSVVKEFIREKAIKEIYIFSAAIWDDKDKNRFNKELKSWLENVLEIKIIDCISMTDVWEKTQWRSVKFESVQEMLILIGKRRMFEDWCLTQEENNSVNILLDDSFGNCLFVNQDRNITIQIIDVTKL